MAMPSQTPITGNSIGSPPAALTPALTASVIDRKWTCPGIMALYELTTPIQGRLISPSVYPEAFINDRCGARFIPFFALSLLMSILPKVMTIILQKKMVKRIETFPAPIWTLHFFLSRNFKTDKVTGKAANL
jgi:hypothetical protein